jgi:hypothetical protein
MKRIALLLAAIASPVRAHVHAVNFDFVCTTTKPARPDAAAPPAARRHRCRARRRAPPQGPLVRPRWLLIPVLLSLAGIAAGMAWVDWSKGGAGSGLYSREWQPDPVQGYWDPDRFYQPTQLVEGVYPAAECIACHEALTPGIVADWRDSRHSRPASRAPVACPDCHGADHQKLHMPTPKVCAGCHAEQHDAFQSEKQYGFPSHVLAMERATDSKHFVDKPKAETTACVQCHSVATKCDSCHTRHRFAAAEARRPEACTTCHSGPPHPDDETFYASAHGKRYLADAQETDWSKPLRKGNYAVPTCAYCHMRNGQHVVADKSIWGNSACARSIPTPPRTRSSASAGSRSAWTATTRTFRAGN